MRKANNPYNVKKCLPRMSWSPRNLFNLHQRSFGPPSSETKFTKTTKTLFQQQFLSRKLVRGYHGDWLQEGRFQSHYLPATLPPIVDNTQSNPLKKGKGSKESHERVPLGSMMFAKLESRLDVLIFRACLAPSVYKARHMVIHGCVNVDGIKENNPNITLNPGQMFSVNPAAIDMLQPSATAQADAQQAEAEASSQPPPPSAAEAEESSEAQSEQAEASSEEASAEADEAAQASPPTKAKAPKADPSKVLPFHLPDYAAPFLFVPPYLEVNFPTASAVYVRHPTAGPGYSEVPTPFEADGEVVRLAWEWYAQNGKRRMHRPARPGNDYRKRGTDMSHIVNLKA